MLVPMCSCVYPYILLFLNIKVFIYFKLIIELWFNKIKSYKFRRLECPASLGELIPQHTKSQLTDFAPLIIFIYRWSFLISHFLLRICNDFIIKIQNLSLAPDDILVSFDVVWKFTKVPLRGIYLHFAEELLPRCLTKVYFPWKGS